MSIEAAFPLTPTISFISYGKLYRVNQEVAVLRLALYLKYMNISEVCKIVKNAFGKCVVHLSAFFHSSSDAKLVNTIQMKYFLACYMSECQIGEHPTQPHDRG
jgi:hypothetical protein